MSNCEGGNSIIMFSKVAGKVYEKWNYFEASCDPVLTFSEQNFVAGQYLADYTKSRVSSEKKKDMEERRKRERERWWNQFDAKSCALTLIKCLP